MFKKILLKALIFLAAVALISSPIQQVAVAQEVDYPYLITKPCIKPSKAGALQVLEKNCGKTLCDKNGNPVQLRGMNTHSLQWYPEIINNNAFAAVSKDWGANVIRLCMFVTQGGYGTNPEIKQKVIDGINLAIANDMYVIVDWHVLIPGDPNAQVYAGAKDFFKEISGMYPNNKNIIYELANEPNSNEPGVSNDANGWKAVKSYAEPIIKQLRDAGNENIILVGTPSWSQRPDLVIDDPINDKNTMYTVHFYAGSHLPGDYVMQDMDYALKKGVPIFVSEWGPTRSNGDGGPFFENSDKWLNYLNKNNISWCDFCLTNKKEKSATFINYEYGKTNPTLLDPGNDQKWDIKELTVTGEYIRARIKGIPYQPVNRGNRKDYSNVVWNFDNRSQGFGVDADSPVKDVTVKNVNNTLQISGLSKSNDVSMAGFWSNVRISSDGKNASLNIWGAEKLTMDVIANKPTTVSIAAIPQNETHPWENPVIAERVNPEDFKLQKDGTYKALMTILPDDAPGLCTIGQDCGHSILENIVLFIGSESDVISLDNITISGNSCMERPVQHDPLGNPTIPSSFEDNTRNGWEWSTASTVNSKMTIKNANNSKALSWEMGYPKYKPVDSWATAAMLNLHAVNATIGDNDKFVFDLYIAPKNANTGGINIAANLGNNWTNEFKIDFSDMKKLPRTSDGLYYYKVSYDLSSMAIKPDTVISDITLVLTDNKSDFSGKMYMDNVRFEKS